MSNSMHGPQPSPISRPTATPDDRRVIVKPHWLLLTAAVSVSAAAGAPPASSGATAAAPRPRAAIPDDALIEFLGADDIPDAHWWDYFSRREARTAAPATPTQGSKQ